jgi:hypothetical protein
VNKEPEYPRKIPPIRAVERALLLAREALEPFSNMGKTLELTGTFTPPTPDQLKQAHYAMWTIDLLGSEVDKKS